MKNNNGITLIALVITIVILMIIAGVGLNIAVGENGIFTKAGQAANTYLYSAKAEQAELDKVFAELEGLTGGDKKNAYAWKLQEQGFSATQTDTGYLKADTSRDDYVTLYTLDENGNEVSSEQIEYTNPELFLFDASSGSITGINTDISDDVYYEYRGGVYADEYLQNNTLVIPRKINGVEVKSMCIGNGGIVGAERIIIPDSIQKIDDYCFGNNWSLKEILLPNGIKNIKYCAFYQCHGLKHINIPSTVETIEFDAFYQCYGLKEITIPNSVTSIGNAAFSKCLDLESVIIGNSVTSIGNAAFRRCENLKEVTIPNSVTTIESYAFEKCYNLEEVYIPSSVTSIESWGTFNYMKPGSIIYVENESVKNLLYKTENNDSNYTYYYTRVIVDPTRTAGKNEPIYYYTADTSNDSYCILYTQDKYGNRIKEERVEYVDSDLFAFDASTGAITGINYDFDDEHVYYEDWEGILLGNYVEETLAIPSKINGVQVKSVKLCDRSNSNLAGVKKIIIPDGVEKIDDNAFYNCYGLENIVIPNSVTSIGWFAFNDCRALKEITIPSGVTSIGQLAFVYCSSLQKVTIPNSVTSIGNSAFSSCSSLQEVIIPNSVTSIGYDAFNKCTSLKEVIIPNSVTSIGAAAFYSLAQGSTIYVQSDAVKTRLSGRYTSGTIVVVDPSKF